MSPKPDKPRSGGSFWTTGPGILTGVAAIITAIGGLVAALHSAGLLGAGTTPQPAGVVSPPAAVATAPVRDLASPPAAQPAPPGGAGRGGCLVTYFQQIPAGRVLTLEAGTRDFQLIGPDQSKQGPIGVKFTDGNQQIGAMRFMLIPANSIFKVETVVDAACRPLEDYLNASRGGDKHVLQNWDSLKLRLGNQTYELRLGYDAGTVSANFIRVSP